GKLALEVGSTRDGPHSASWVKVPSIALRFLIKKRWYTILIAIEQKTASYMLVCQHSWPVVSLGAKLVGGEGSLVRSS
uniref:Uncharacterized protein n=1 Tax=Aegilops tauschii subsp. strangulata TaxID=200361 RepID=A0A453G354_AEGTS